MLIDRIFKVVIILLILGLHVAAPLDQIEPWSISPQPVESRCPKTSTNNNTKTTQKSAQKYKNTF